MARENYCYREVIPLAAMLTVECTNVGLSTIYKAAVSKGLSYHVFMVYSYAISALVVLPLSCLFHRKTPLPPVTILLLGKFFILGLLGFAAQFLGYLGIAYSSPTMGSAMSNLTPATTFFLAILFRMEKIKIKTSSSQAKIIGTLVSIIGAIIVVLYNGPIVIDANHDKRLPSFGLHTISAHSNWIIGGVLLGASYALVSLWYIFQAKFVNEYPAEFVVVFYYNLFACISSLPVCIFLEPNLSTWKIQANIQLYSVLYSGIIGSGFGLMVHTWGLHVKGPVYVALFKPLSIAIAAFFGVIFLGENLYLGSVIGSIIISVGFYTVMWGKMKESIEEISNDSADVASSSQNLDSPLLNHHIDPTNRNAGV